MGDRLLGPGKERIEWTGTLNPMDSGEVAVRIIWEFPRKVRVEKQLGPEAGRNVEVTVYDGENLRKSHGLVKPEDEDLVEMLTHDSVEGFFVGQIEGFSARFLGSGYREQDESGNPIGPSYDIYWVTDWFNVSGRYLLQRKLYYFDSLHGRAEVGPVHFGSEARETAQEGEDSTCRMEPGRGSVDCGPDGEIRGRRRGAVAVIHGGHGGTRIGRRDFFKTLRPEAPSITAGRTGT